MPVCLRLSLSVCVCVGGGGCMCVCVSETEGPPPAGLDRRSRGSGRPLSVHLGHRGPPAPHTRPFAAAGTSQTATMVLMTAMMVTMVR